MNGVLQTQIAFDNPTGNIQSKSGIGDYAYTLPQPHAVNSITEGTVEYVPAAPQTIHYTSFNKVNDIAEGSYTMNITYGADHQRSMTELDNGTTLVKRKYFIDKFEKEEYPDGTSRKLFYIYAPTGIVAIYEMKSAGTNNMHYVYTDHLGSYNVITDANGTVEEQLSFDAWGRRRNPNDWSYNNVLLPTIITRGYTGHEHLDQFAIINMNGRLYDPNNGRMFSPDNYVQDASSSQNFNRYSYCLNNPLKYTDPSGNYFIIDDIIAATVGGTTNVLSNIEHVKNLKQFFEYFGVGAIGSEATLYLGPYAGFAIGGTLNIGVDALNGFINKKSNFENYAQSFIRGGLSSLAGAQAGVEALNSQSNLIDPATNALTNKLFAGEEENIISKLLISGTESVVIDYSQNSFNFTNKNQDLGAKIIGSFVGGAIGSYLGDKIIPESKNFKFLNHLINKSTNSIIGNFIGDYTSNLIAKHSILSTNHIFTNSINWLKTSCYSLDSQSDFGTALPDVEQSIFESIIHN